MPSTRGNGKNCVDAAATGDAANEYLEKARLRAAMAKTHNQVKNKDVGKPAATTQGAQASTPSKPASPPEVKGTPGKTSTKSMLVYTHT